MVTAVSLHILAAIVWIGGMFFAVLVLRPSAFPLEPPDRLALWRRVFQRFFSWVWLSLALLLGTWRHNPGHPASFDNDGVVDVADLAVLLGTWGSCE